MMTRTLFAFSLGFAGLLLATQSGFAAPQCGPRDGMVGQLAATYGESRRGIGIAGPSQVMELFANAQSGTWSITVTMPEGVMCLVASGQGFEALNDPLPAKGDPD